MINCMIPRAALASICLVLCAAGTAAAEEKVLLISWTAQSSQSSLRKNSTWKAIGNRWAFAGSEALAAISRAIRCVFRMDRMRPFMSSPPA